MPDEQPDDFETPPPFFPLGDSDSGEEDELEDELVGVDVEGVFFTDRQGEIQRFVLVADGERKLPILIGAFEASAISLPLEDAKPDRPLPYDLIKSILERIGGEVDRVVIDDLWNRTYYAKIIINVGEQEIEVDARPSDAIALALRTNSPIYVRSSIMNQSTD